MSYLPDSYKVRSGPGVSGVRKEEGKSGNQKPRMKHLFRQDLQDYQDLFWTRISLSCPSRLPGRSFLAKPG
jgi:hypothetical protein